MTERPYIHGTSEREQRRLVEQADLLRDLLADNLELHPGEHLLEIGCGVGAVLGQIALSQPEARLSGIDLNPEQIATARSHLAGLGLEAVELVVGNAAQLPWPDGQFDRIRVVWVVEHLADPLAVLHEARRVLRPGGTIHLTETDYASLRVSPPDPAIAAFLAAFVAHFNRHGDAHAGPRLGPLLEQAGFTAVDNRIAAIHYWCPGQRRELKRFCAYLLQFISPELPALLAAAASPAAAEQIREGHDRFSRLNQRDDASVSLCIYQARGRVGGQPADRWISSSGSGPPTGPSWTTT